MKGTVKTVIGGLALSLGMETGMAADFMASSDLLKESMLWAEMGEFVILLPREPKENAVDSTSSKLFNPTFYRQVLSVPYATVQNVVSASGEGKGGSDGDNGDENGLADPFDDRGDTPDDLGILFGSHLERAKRQKNLLPPLPEKDLSNQVLIDVHFKGDFPPSQKQGKARRF